MLTTTRTSRRTDFTSARNDDKGSTTAAMENKQQNVMRFSLDSARSLTMRDLRSPSRTNSPSRTPEFSPEPATASHPVQDQSKTRATMTISRLLESASVVITL